MHATHLTDADIADLDRSSTGVCFCPTTERDLGDGIGPAAALLAGRGLFSLGSDSHAVIDLFEEARAVELDERLASGQRGVILAADRLLRAATWDGQQALGWTDAGRTHRRIRAPISSPSTSSPSARQAAARRWRTSSSPPRRADVTDVVIDGEVVVADRRHLTVPDVAGELSSAINELMGSNTARATR